MGGGIRVYIDFAGIAPLMEVCIHSLVKSIMFLYHVYMLISLFSSCVCVYCVSLYVCVCVYCVSLYVSGEIIFELLRNILST